MRALPRLLPSVTKVASAAALSLLLLTGCGDSLTEGGVAMTAQTRETLDILPANAEVVGMMNLRAARAAGTLETIMNDEARLRGMTGGGSAAFSRFLQETGFDPSEDLDRVYVAMGEAGPAIVGHGRYDRERIARFLNDQGEMEEITLGGLPAYRAAEEDGEPFAVLLANNAIILAGTERLVEGMAARLQGASSGLSSDAALTRLIHRAGYGDGAWFVSRDLSLHGDSYTSTGRDGSIEQAARLADDVVFSLGFKPEGIGVDAYVTPRAGASSADLADLLRGSVSALRLSAKDEPQLLDALDETTVDESDGGVRIRSFLHDDLVAKMHNE